MKPTSGPKLDEDVRKLPSLAEIAALSGLEKMQAVLDGDPPMPRIARTVGFSLGEVGEGRVVFEGTNAFGRYNVLGGVQGDWFGVLLDCCMGCSVHTMLPRGTGYTTLKYKVNGIRAAAIGIGPLRAIGEAIYVGRRTGFAEGRLEDAEGRTLRAGRLDLSDL